MKALGQKDSNSPSSKKQGCLGIIAFICFLMVTCSVLPDDKLDNGQQDTKIEHSGANTVDSTHQNGMTQEGVGDSAINPGLQITPTELGSKIDILLAEETGQITHLSQVVVQGNGFSEYLDGVEWSGVIDDRKSGELISTEFYTQVNAYQDEAQQKVNDLLFYVSGVARVLHPELPNDQTAGRMADMLLDVLKELDSGKDVATSSVTIEEVKYTINAQFDGMEIFTLHVVIANKNH